MRAAWSGHVSFGMVNIPVKAYTATDEQSVKFNQLHRECGSSGMGYTRDEVFAHAHYEVNGESGGTMSDIDFAKLADKSRLTIHRIFTRLKQMHEAGASTNGA